MRSLARGGDTPLHASAASGTPDAARLLLARGADPLKKNAAGETPLDLARRFGGDRQGIAEIVGLLEQAEAFAAVEQAEREAKEAERLAAASSGEETYEGILPDALPIFDYYEFTSRGIIWVCTR